jgi:hypothetical protein
MTTETPRRPATAVGRPLSPLERWYWIADQVTPFNCIGRLRVRGHLPPAVLRAALDELQARHPLLRAAIATDDGERRPRFVPSSAPVPLRLVTVTGPDAGADDRWVTEVNEREIVDPIDWRTGPLCRATLLTGPGGTPEDDAHELLLTMPHTVADGTTMLSLLRQVLDIAAAVTAGTGTGGPALATLPGPEDLFRRRYRGRLGALRVTWRMFRDARRTRRDRPGRVEPSESVPFRNRRSRVLHRGLTVEQLDALVAACRRERTSVHGTLAAAMAAAVARDADARRPSHVAIGSAIDFRGDLAEHVPADAVGTYAATVASFAGYLPGASLWPMARAVNRDLTRRKRRGEHFDMVNMVGLSCPQSVEDAWPLIEFIDRSGPVNLCISNVGRIDFPRELGPWQLSAPELMGGLSVVGYLIGLVSTCHGRLSWNFSYVEDVLPRERAEAIVDDCVGLVLAAIQEQRP